MIMRAPLHVTLRSKENAGLRYHALGGQWPAASPCRCFRCLRKEGGFKSEVQHAQSQTATALLLPLLIARRVQAGRASAPEDDFLAFVIAIPAA